MALSGGEQPAMIDTLAMAYAETGRFDDAISREQAAIEILKTSKDSELLAEMEQRLALYQARRAFRETTTNLFANSKSSQPR